MGFKVSVGVVRTPLYFSLNYRYLVYVKNIDNQLIN